MRGLDSEVVKSLACHHCDPESIPCVRMWQDNGRLSKAGAFPWDLLFSPSRTTTAGHDSLMDSDAAWDARGTAIDPRIRHIFLLRFGHENISTTTDLRRAVVS